MVIRQYATVYKQRGAARLPRAVQLAYGVAAGMKGGEARRAAGIRSRYEVVPIPHLLWHILPHGVGGLHVDTDKSKGGRERKKDGGGELKDHGRRPRSQLSAGTFVLLCAHGAAVGESGCLGHVGPHRHHAACSHLSLHTPPPVLTRPPIYAHPSSTVWLRCRHVRHALPGGKPGDHGFSDAADASGPSPIGLRQRPRAGQLSHGALSCGFCCLRDKVRGPDAA